MIHSYTSAKADGNSLVQVKTIYTIYPTIMLDNKCSLQDKGATCYISLQLNMLDDDMQQASQQSQQINSSAGWMSYKVDKLDLELWEPAAYFLRQK